MTGCDFFFLQKNPPDAGVDVRDADVDVDTVDAFVDTCPRDTFGGAMLNADKWTPTGTNAQINIVVADLLRFDYGIGASLGSKGIASQRIFDFTGKDVIAHLSVTPTQNSSFTALVVMTPTFGTVYKIEIDGNSQMKVHVGNTDTNSMAFSGPYVRIRDAGQGRVGFATSADGRDFGTETTFAKLGAPPDTSVRVGLDASLLGIQSSASSAVWQSITTTCD